MINDGELTKNQQCLAKIQKESQKESKKDNIYKENYFKIEKKSLLIIKLRNILEK